MTFNHSSINIDDILALKNNEVIYKNFSKTANIIISKFLKSDMTKENLKYFINHLQTTCETTKTALDINYNLVEKIYSDNKTNPSENQSFDDKLQKVKKSFMQYKGRNKLTFSEEQKIYTSKSYISEINKNILLKREKPKKANKHIEPEKSDKKEKKKIIATDPLKSNKPGNVTVTKGHDNKTNVKNSKK